jgi:hypothetical protein
MTEAAIRVQARLYAIEYLLSDLWTKWYLFKNATNERVASAHTETIDHLKVQTFPGMDPAEADAFSAELEIAVSDILEMQRLMLAAANSQLGRS